jgi:hypothetical protein
MTLSRGVFELTATILKGPNSAFRKKRIQLTQPLDAGRLYLLNDGSLRALELAPFVRVLAGQMGQDACYFYNRLEGTGARWVSYHFHAEPELVLPDDGLPDLLAKLAPPPTAGQEATRAATSEGGSGRLAGWPPQPTRSPAAPPVATAVPGRGPLGGTGRYPVR